MNETHKMKTIASYSKPEEAYLAASYLEGNGIEAHVRDDNIITANWLFSNAVGGVKLEVADEDAAKALELLSEIK